MTRALSNATTRLPGSRRGVPSHREPYLRPAQVVVSPESQLSYRVERLLGRGGFGDVFLARRLGRSARVPAMICIKASRQIDGWLREA